MRAVRQVQADSYTLASQTEASHNPNRPVFAASFCCSGAGSSPELHFTPTCLLPFFPLPQGDLYEAYKREFDRSYYGNRAPVGVYIHAAWLMDPTRAREWGEAGSSGMGVASVTASCTWQYLGTVAHADGCLRCHQLL